MTDIVSTFNNNCKTERLSKQSTFICKNPILEKTISPAGHKKSSSDIYQRNPSRKTIRFNCKFCDKNFRLNHILNIHISKKHAIDTKNVDQKLCLKLQKIQGVWHSRFISKNVNVDMDYETGHKCQICHQNFSTKLHLNDHAVHCKMSNPAKSNMSMRSRCNYHTNANSKCSMCKQKLLKKCLGSENTSEVGLNQSLTEFDSSSSIMANDAKKPIKRFCCSTCKDTFPSMGILIAHQSLHIITRPYICRFCDRKFSNNGYRKNHEKVHGININTFDSNDNESQQKNEHQSCNQMHQDRYCSLCKKQYIHLGAFRNHMVKMHFRKTTFNDNVQINPVDVVENITSIKLEYSNDLHQVKCVCCNKMFDGIVPLKLHLSFTSRCNNYYMHIQPEILLNSLVNQCTICHKTYSTFNNRKRHIIHVHKILETDCL